MPKIKLSPFLKNLTTTTITSLISIISLIFIMRFFAKGLGSEEFGAYSLARRIISNIIPLATLSINISLARYIAMTRENKQRSAYIISSIISTGGAIVLILIIAVSASKQLSYWIFHSNEYLNLYYASLFLLVGYSIFTIIYAYFRGVQKFNMANSIHLCLIAIIPLLISYFFAYKKNAAWIMFLIGSAYYLSIIPLIWVITKIKLPQLSEVRSAIKTLLKYSLPRVPAGFVFAGLLTLGPFLAGIFIGLEEAGYFIIGQSVFRVMESAIVGFGFVALPKVSQLLAEKKVEFLKSKIEDILIMIFQLGLFVSIHIFIWSKEIVLIWLSSEYSEAVPVMKIIIISLGPYLGYVILRSIIDAVEVRAINTLYLSVSFLIAAVVSIIFFMAGLGITGLAIGTTVGFFTLGIMTCSFLMRRYKISFRNFMLQWILLLNLLSAIFVLLIKRYMATYLNLPNLLITGFIIECVFFLCYLYFFQKKGVRWFSELKKRIFSETNY